MSINQKREIQNRIVGLRAEQRWFHKEIAESLGIGC